jgi:hypothetical protein
MKDERIEHLEAIVMVKRHHEEEARSRTNTYLSLTRFKMEYLYKNVECVEQWLLNPG